PLVTQKVFSKPKKQQVRLQIPPKSVQLPQTPRQIQTEPILFHKVLRQERLRHGWRVGEMAEQLGVNANTVAKWEQGQKIPQDPISIQNLCSLLNKTSEELGLKRTSSF